MEMKSDFRFVFAAYSILLCVTLVPIWSIDNLPLQDYPNHLARIHIIENLRANEFLQKFYRLQFDIIPNLGMEIVTPLFTGPFSLETAGRLTLSLIILSITSGALFLHYALFRTVGFWPLLTFLLVFNEAFLRGFIAFLLGVGLAIWGIGLWIMMRHVRLWLLGAIFSLFSIVLFFFHLYAFAFYAVTLVVYEAGRAVWGVAKVPLIQRFERLALCCAQFVIPMLLYLHSPTGFRGRRVVFAPVSDKLLDYPFKVFAQYNRWLDLASLLFILAALAVGVWKARIRFHAHLIAPVVALFAVYFLLPASLATTFYTDWRILVPLSIVILSSVGAAIGNFAFVRTLCAALTLLVAANAYSVMSRWKELEPQYKGILAAIDRLENGALLFAARGYLAAREREEALPFMHAPTLAIVRRSALVPSLFADEMQQPVRFTKEYHDLARATSRPAYGPKRLVPWDQVLAHYDYALLAREELLRDLPRTRLEEVFRSHDIVLYRIKPGPLPER